MNESKLGARHSELRSLLDLTGRVGRDPLLTQASSGNSSVKLDGVLWIKASGRWMADAVREDILMPLNLPDLRECFRQGVDPAERYENASLETAMHSVLPHRVALHVHCVNTIAWAVRADGPAQLTCRLNGLPWQWIPYAASGLPLARGVQRAIASQPDTDVFVLGNHGLVIGGEDSESVEALLRDVQDRLAVVPREAHPPDYSALLDISEGSAWDLPDDEQVHSLGTDRTAQAILAGGLMYASEAIFAGARTPELFRPIPFPEPGDDWQEKYQGRPFLVIQGRGVLVGRSMTPAELATLSGLTQVALRVSGTAPMRYLSEGEVAALSSHMASRYRLSVSRVPAGENEAMQDRVPI